MRTEAKTESDMTESLNKNISGDSPELDGLNEGQKKAVLSDGVPTFIFAGAGTGKTHTISRKVSHAMIGGSEGIDPSELVTITFTEAAASELSDRIRRDVKSIDPDKAKKMSQARISTIHSDAKRTLSEHAFDAGIDPGMEIIEDEEAGQIMMDAVWESIDALIKEGSLSMEELSYIDIDAVMQVAFTIVSSDTGMGTDVSQRTGIEFASIDDTVSKLIGKMIEELQETVEESLPQCRLTAANTKSDKSLPKVEAYYDQICVLGECSPVFLRVPSPTWNQRISPYGDLKKTVKGISVEISALSKSAPKHHRTWEIASRASEIYTRMLRQAGKATFDTLLYEANRLLSEHPEIKDEITGSIRLIIIDEFQDTNAQQVAVAKKIAAPDLSNMMCVGDRKQSIYRFRGGDVNVSTEMRKEMGVLGGNDIPIDINYRSHRDILDFTEEVFCATDQGTGEAILDMGEPDLESVRLQSPNDPKFHEPVPLDADGEPVCRVSMIQCEGKKSGDATVKSAWAIVREIQRSLESGIIEDYGEAALLLKTTTNIGIYMEAFRKAGIPHKFAAGRLFYKLDEIAPICLALSAALARDNAAMMESMLAAGVSAQDIVALKVRMTEASRALRETEGEADPVSLVDIAKEYGGLPGKIAKAVEEATAKIRDNEDAGEIVMFLAQKSGVMAKALSDPTSGAARWANIQKLADIASSYRAAGATAHDSITAIVADYHEALSKEKESPAQLMEAKSSGVSIMTMHASKGLQFKLVAIGVEPQDKNDTNELAFRAAPGDPSRKEMSFAFNKSTNKDKQPRENPNETIARIWDISAGNNLEKSQESARLLYVAFTRAEKRLVYTGRNTENSHFNSVSQIMAMTGDDKSYSFEHVLFGDEEQAAAKSRYGQAGTTEDNVPIPDIVYTRDIAEERMSDSGHRCIRKFSFSSLAKRLGLFNRLGMESASVIEDMQEDEGLASDGETGTPMRSNGYHVSAPTVPAVPYGKMSDRTANSKISLPEVVGADNSRVLSWGSAVHAALHRAIVSGRLPEAGQRAICVLEDICRRNCVEDRADELRGIVRDYITGEMYREFEENAVRVRPECPICCPIPGTDDMLIGYMDLVCDKSEHGRHVVEITDWKTGYRGVDEEDIARLYELQMLLYSYAVLRNEEIRDQSRREDGNDDTAPETIVRARICLVDRDWEVIDGLEDTDGEWEAWEFSVSDIGKVEARIREIVRSPK